MVSESGTLYLKNNGGDSYEMYPLVCNLWRVCDGLTEFKEIVKKVSDMNDKIYMEQKQLTKVLSQSIFELRKKDLMM